MTCFHIFHDKNSAFKPLPRIWGLMPPFTSRLAIAAWTVLSCKVYCDRNAKKHIFGVIRFITGQASGNCWTWKRRIGDAASDCHRCGFSANEAPCCSQLSSPLAMWKTYTLTLTRKWCSQCTNVLRGCRIFKACNILHQCLDISPRFLYICSFMLLLLPLPSDAAHEPPDTELMASTYLAKRRKETGAQHFWWRIYGGFRAIHLWILQWKERSLYVFVFN